MNAGSWWEERPDRIRQETDALDAAGIDWVRADPADPGGVAELDATVDGPSGPVTIRATYPDEYPHFPPRVAAPDLGLTHHHEHGGGTVCLLAPGGRDWIPSRTLAWLLTEQWPKVLAANAGDGTGPDGKLLETDQGEPWTAYVEAEPGANVVLAGSFEPPLPLRSGSLAYVAVRTEPLGAVVVSLSDSTGAVIGSAGPLHTLDPPHRPGAWIRLDEAPENPTAAGLWAAAEAQDPAAASGGWGPDPARGPAVGRRAATGGRQMQMLLVRVPEETARRTAGEGWIAVVRYRSDPRKPPGRARAVRVSRAGRDDLYVRSPGTAPLKDRTVLLVGVGGLGAAIGAELGKLGLAALDLADADAVDPAAAARFQGAFRFAGLPKVTAVGRLALETQPYTRVTGLGLHLGRVRTPGQPDNRALLRERIAAADLVVDATADVGAQQLLSDMARAAGTAYLQAEATPGVWAGLIALYPPGTDLCWVCVQHHLDDGGIPPLPHTDGPAVQPPGCLEPTYPGAGFDLAAIAAQAVRQAVSHLTDGPGGYGPPTAPVVTVRLRDAAGRPVLPDWQEHPVGRHPSCGNHP